MRHLLIAALGVFAVSGAASAQQPQSRPVPQYPAVAPGTTLQPVSGTTVIRGTAGCNNCAPAVGPVVRGGFTMSAVTGGNCLLGNPCQNGCGSVRSDLGFHFGSCKQFFAPCGPTPLAAPWGKGFGCPRAYDSYANH